MKNIMKRIVAGFLIVFNGVQAVSLEQAFRDVKVALKVKLRYVSCDQEQLEQQRLDAVIESIHALARAIKSEKNGCLSCNLSSITDLYKVILDECLESSCKWHGFNGKTPILDLVHNYCEEEVFEFDINKPFYSFINGLWLNIFEHYLLEPKSKKYVFADAFAGNRLIEYGAGFTSRLPFPFFESKKPHTKGHLLCDFYVLGKNEHIALYAPHLQEKIRAITAEYVAIKETKYANEQEQYRALAQWFVRSTAILPFN